MALERPEPGLRRERAEGVQRVAEGALDDDAVVAQPGPGLTDTQ